MKKYKVIKPFRNLKTGALMAPGEVFEVEDKEREEKALKLKLVEPMEAPKEKLESLGGGWYQLPNGEKVKGKKNAMEKLESGD